MAEQDQDFIEFIVKNIVEKPEAVKIDRKLDEMGVLLELSVDPVDMGKIIGKEGRTAKALRTLLRLVGVKNNARINLKIVEPEGSVRPVKAEVKEEKAEKKETEEKPVKEEKIEEKEEKEEEKEEVVVEEEEKATEIV